MALQQYKKEKFPNLNQAKNKLKEYLPSFVDDIELIIKEMESLGSRVVLVTLPGLYVKDKAPTKREMEIGHLPSFTDNPYFLAEMTGRYNNVLRKLGKTLGLQVIDLERWSKGAFKPRQFYFVDSVHVTNKAEELIGEYMANELVTASILHETARDNR